ncbi:MAG: DNA polymerase III subunit alpha [Succinivibrionaceae bacterium]
MSNPKFVHLYVHTDYSMCDGLMSVGKVVKLASSMNMAAIAITDYMNQCNMVKLYEESCPRGIKPIFGIELNVLDDSNSHASKNNFYRIKLYAINKIGYRNIVELQSDGWRQGSIDYKTCVRLSWLKKYSEGVICLSGGYVGDICEYLWNNREDLAQKRIDLYKEIYPNRFYIEISRCNRNREEEYNQNAIKLAIKNDLPIVATNPVMFAKREDFETHKIRVAVQDKVTLGDERWVHPYTDAMYMRSVDEMCELFKDLPEALENSVQIAKRCSVSLSLGKNYLPKFPTGDLTDAEYLTKEAYTGLESRLEFLYPDEKEREKQRPRYVERLQKELDVIIKMDFPGYFLIVMEFIQWSKNNHVPVGPGRGSGGGSLVAYAIRITDFDPLRFDLLFERFLNPERVSMPDFDVDFCMDNRGRVIQHVADMYGRQSVSQIITFGTLAAKASVKAVARVTGKSYSFGDRLAKLIPNTPGITLNQTLGRDEKKPELKVQDFIDLYQKDEECREVIDIALQLEGITTSHGKHAGGVVISPTVITDFAPLMCDDFGADYKTQFDKHDVEEAGLVKFDFLGLKTLTTIDWALDMINARMDKEGKPRVNISRIDLEDPESYKVLQSTETTAVFQLESPGMRDLIGKMKPDHFEDMIALVALYRPGPIGCGMVDNFVRRKHGEEEVAYPDPQFQHECLKPILDPTYGIIVYQEQVMQIAQALAGYTLGGADLLRRAMGKKKPEEMAKQRSVFKKGAEDKGIDGDLAMKIFDQVEKFAGYGFNKSHSAAYALVAFQTLWLKTHYPAEFLAAMMTSDKENTDKIVVYINECRRLKIPVDPPDVNQGQVHFIVNEEGHIVFSLGAVKGVGEGPVMAIMEARKNGGNFRNLFDFCRRIDSKKISRRVMESLIMAGSLDKLGPHRASLMATLDKAMKLASQTSADRENGCLDLFASADFDSFNDPEFEDVPPYPDKVWLKGEVDTLGLYLTGHPIDRYSKEITNFSNINIADVQPTTKVYGEEQKRYTIAGIVVKLEHRTTKNGAHFMQGFILDYTGEILFSLWRDDYEKYKDLIVPDMLIVATGTVSYDDYNKCKKIKIEEIMNIIEARMKFGRCMRIAIDKDSFNTKNFVQRLEETVKKYSGPMPIELLLQNNDSVFITNSNYKIDPSDEVMDVLKYLCNGRVAISYA